MRDELLTIKRGARVQLTKEANKAHTCPKGRKNNRTAIVLSVHGEDNDQVTTIDDLRGCRSWNIEDLQVVVFDDDIVNFFSPKIKDAVGMGKSSEVANIIKEILDIGVDCGKMSITSQF